MYLSINIYLDAVHRVIYRINHVKNNISNWVKNRKIKSLSTNEFPFGAFYLTVVKILRYKDKIRKGKIKEIYSYVYTVYPK